MFGRYIIQAKEIIYLSFKVSGTGLPSNQVDTMETLPYEPAGPTAESLATIAIEAIGLKQNNDTICNVLVWITSHVFQPLQPWNEICSADPFSFLSCQESPTKPDHDDPAGPAVSEPAAPSIEPVAPSDAEVPASQPRGEDVPLDLDMMKAWSWPKIQNTKQGYRAITAIAIYSHILNIKLETS